jgi:hypothetical protein
MLFGSFRAFLVPMYIHVTSGRTDMSFICLKTNPFSPNEELEKTRKDFLDSIS